MNGPSRHNIWKMFDAISPTYDRVNRVMTLGLDQWWRRQLCRHLPPKKNLRILDCATGTADQAIALSKREKVEAVVGIDLAEEMIAIGTKKVEKLHLSDRIQLQVASALDIPFAEESFDCVTISFGIRNVSDVDNALREFLRVLKPGGRLLILESTLSPYKWIKGLHLFYLRHLLPRIGGALSKNKQAYHYLNKTIETFPQGEAFCAALQKAGFKKVSSRFLMGGVVAIYQGDKDDLP